jgi:cell division transport system permease protein
MWVKTKRMLQSGFVNFWRNGTISLSAVLMMIVALFVISSVLFVGALLTSSLNQIKDKVDINIYFVTSAPESDILALQKNLQAMPEVKSVDYVSSDQALQNFKDRHINDQLTIQALAELNQNPLGAVLNVKAKEPSQYEGIASFLQDNNLISKNGAPIVESVNYAKNKVAIDRLTTIISSGQKLGFAITILLVLISILITFNTIRLVIYMSREEISVMKLVGASNMHVRGPFVVTGFMYGAVSALITIIILYPIMFYMRGFTSAFAGVDLLQYYLRHFGEIFVLLVCSGVLIGGISSYLAVKRYLKV